MLSGAVCALAPTHAMVLFDDGSSSTIPVTRIVEPASRILKVGETVEVQWSYKAIYEATIQALGTKLQDTYRVYHFCTTCIYRKPERYGGTH